MSAHSHGQVVEDSAFTTSHPQGYYSYVPSEYANGQQHRYEHEFANGQQTVYEHGSSYQQIHPSPSQVLVPPKEADLSALDRKPSRIHRLWLWEVAASVLSLASIASVVVVLSYENGKPLSQWQQGVGKDISPTAVVSFLGTIGKSSCLVAVAEIISQLKWMHFKATPRKLTDLELFDEASRGPWGAFKLVVFKTRRAPLAMIASVITLAALLIDPFLQLVFEFPTRLTPVQGVFPTIRATQVYDPDLLWSRRGQCYGFTNINSAMQAAILSPVWKTTPPPSLPCTFERCDWPTITTLGVCSKCEDFTDTVVSDCSIVGANRYHIDCNYTIPAIDKTFTATFSTTGGPAAMAPYQTLWKSVAKHPFEYNYQGIVPAEISRFSFIRLAPDLPWQSYFEFPNEEEPYLSQNPPVERAMQCRFELCARTFTSPYYANFSEGPLLGSSTPLVADFSALEITDAPALLDLTPADSDHPPMNTTFQINHCDYIDLSGYLGDAFSLEYNSSDITIDTVAFGDVGPALSETYDIPGLLQSIADSMTEAIRTSANSTAINGIGMNTVTYISITWGWLVLPVAVVVLTFIMLFVVIIRNHVRGIPAWKSSSLAMLFHDLEGWEKSDCGAGSPHEVRKRAATMTARVVNEGDVLCFSRDGCSQSKNDFPVSNSI